MKDRKLRKLLGGGLALRGGAYALGLSAVVLAILVAVNLLARALPATATQLDMSASQLYSITSNTKVVVNALEEDVTIYWIVQAGEEDDVIENLLSKYESLSDHITVEKRNPDVYPTFAQQYTDETVTNNSLVVVCGERYRYIPNSDIYVQELDMNSYGYTTSFDGEGCVTSAIDYVVSEDLPQLYLLEGHGEAELPTEFAGQLEKENIETVSLSLLSEGSVPEEADCVMIYAPESDISTEEKDILADYVAGGGKLLVCAGPTEEDGILENLYGLLADYGVTASEGIVVEGDSGHYAFQTPYLLMPDMAESDITSPLIADNYYVLMPISLGLTVGEDTGGATVTELLTTSDAAFSKVAGYALDTFEKEDGDIDGPFALAVSVETGEGQILWFASSYFLEDAYNAYSSGANGDLGMNAVAALVGEREAMAIRSRSLSYSYLTISASTASAIQVLMIGVLPLAYLGIGIWVALERRRRQRETV